MSELLDGLPREGEAEPRLSGTFSQAWSLAEFIRVFYEDYLGVAVDVPESRLRLRPRLPRDLHHGSTTIRFGSRAIPLELRSGAGTIVVSLSSPGTAGVIDLDCDLEPVRELSGKIVGQEKDAGKAAEAIPHDRRRPPSRRAAPAVFEGSRNPPGNGTTHPGVSPAHTAARGEVA